MGKHEKVKPSGEAAPPPAPVMEVEATPKMALASLDPPKIEMPKIEVPKIATPAIEIPKTESAIIEPPKIELASIEAPHIAPDTDEPQPPSVAAADAPADAAPAASAGPRINRFTMLAAALALSAALGGMVGALGTSALLQPAPAPAVAGRTGLEEIQALKENVVQARVELAALKVSIDAGNRAASAQFTRIGERVERIERVQAEPATKLNKAIETLDRMARADAAAPAKDVTGSITPPQPVAAAAPASTGTVEGWVVRDVNRGTALIEGRTGLVEVDKGDVVPGLGRIEAIRKQDGRWVVVTSKGLIMSAR